MSEFYIEPETVSDTATGIDFFYNDYLNNPAFLVKPHIHSAVEILFIHHGRFRIYADDREFMLYPGDAILFRSHTIHKVFALDGKDSGYHVLKIKPKNVLDSASSSLGASYLLRLSISKRNEKTLWLKSECDSGGISALLSELIAEKNAPQYGSDIAVKLLSARILMLMLRDIEKEHPGLIAQNTAEANLESRIYNSIVYINSNYARDITAEECGKLQYMSYSYFSRSFKRITGMTFKDYLNMTRINQAEKALISGGKSVTDISSECGFNNVSYFISMFKKLKGITPSAFRENLTKGDL